MWRFEGFDTAGMARVRQEFLDTLSCGAPKLFLGGDRDTIVCPNITEEVLGHIREKGEDLAGKLTVQQWPLTSHTLHFRDEPHHYENTLKKYVNNSLSIYVQSNDASCNPFLK